MTEKPLPAYDGDKAYIFVTYSHEDTDLVYPQIRWLQDQGFNVGWDEGISPGAVWRGELAQAIRGCSLLLYFTTPNSVESAHCIREVNFALDEHHRPVLAVHLVKTVLPDALALSLSDRQAILQHALEPEDYERKLVSAIATYLNQPLPEISLRAPIRTSSRQISLTLAVVCLLLGIGITSLVTWLAMSPEFAVSLPLEQQLVAKLSLPPPDGLSFSEMAVSPDGRHLAFTAVDPAGKTELWLRPLDSLTSYPLAGTTEASSPFWSPDGQFIAFFTGNKLRKIDPFNGLPQTICTLPGIRGMGLGAAMGGAWSADGVIIFAIWPLGPAPLYQVSDGGGEPRQVLTVEGFSDRGQRRSPAFLPDGRHFLYLGISDAQTDLTGIYLSSLDNSEAQLLVRADSFAAYALDKTHDKGHLVFVREGTLQAQPFDPSHLTTIGDAVSLTERVGVDQNLRSKFSVSDNGVLVYGTGSGTSELHWFDRKGSSLGALGPQGSHVDFRISPDGLRVADQRDTEPGRADIYLLDPERGTSERITFQQTYYAAPVWTPNSSNLTFFSTREGRWSIWEKATNGMGVERQLLRSENDLVPNDWSADGRILLYTEITLETRGDLWFLTREGDPANEPRLTPFISTPANENCARFSPDGKWVVYSSNQSGRYEIYVRPFPADDTRLVGKLISTHGGSEPRWPRGGKEIFYIDPNDMLMAVKVTTGETVEAGVPNALFLTRPVGAVLRYDVTSDGERFLVATPTDDTVSAPVTVVLNWFAELDRRSL